MELHDLHPMGLFGARTLYKKTYIRKHVRNASLLYKSILTILVKVSGACVMGINL